MTTPAVRNHPFPEVLFSRNGVSSDFLEFWDHGTYYADR